MEEAHPRGGGLPKNINLERIRPLATKTLSSLPAELKTGEHVPATGASVTYVLLRSPKRDRCTLDPGTE